MRVRDVHREQFGRIVEPTAAERADAAAAHGLDYALRWTLVVWHYGTRCWERRAELLILSNPL